MTSPKLSAVTFAVVGLLAGPALAAPNILWITTEDMSPHLGAYGDIYARTPNIDRLAAEGVRYTNAFAPIGVCAPSRSTLITGMYAPSIGTQHMRSKRTLPPALKLYPQLLRAAGYYATNNEKQDYNLVATPADAWDESSPRAHYRNRKDPRQPFFAVFNFMVTHESQVRAPEPVYQQRRASLPAAHRHDPAQAPLPPYHPDAPEVRRDWARYADNVSVMDAAVGELLRALEKDGLADDTIVFFYSDHGAGLPRSKRWLYDSSTRVPLIVRFPKKYQHLAPAPAGSVLDRLVSFPDLTATALALAGAPLPSTLQGRPFLGPQAGPAPAYVFGFRDRMDERIDMLRSVRDKRWRYIRNYLPHRPYAQHLDYQAQMPTMQVWQRLHTEGKLFGFERAFFQPKPAEELYDTWADPHEVTNLAERAEYRPVLDRLRGALERWMVEIRDTGLLPEGELLARTGADPIHTFARDDKRFDPRRLLTAANTATRAGQRPERLLPLLRDGDSGVRFWGATGLALLGARARSAAPALRAALADASSDVRIAAAEALCRIGRAREALPVLERALQHQEDAVRMHVVNVADAIGDDARPLLSALRARQSAEPKDSYTGRALPYVIAKLSAVSTR